MSAFKVSISEDATHDIHKSVAYYNTQVPGLGAKFSAQVKQAVKSLKTNPYFQVRYDAIRCLPLRSFPYMLHYTIDENKQCVEVFGVINTSLNPDEFWIAK